MKIASGKKDPKSDEGQTSLVIYPAQALTDEFQLSQCHLVTKKSLDNEAAMAATADAMAIGWYAKHHCQIAH